MTAAPIHAALQPSWDCIACGVDWPCDPAREELAVRFVDQPVELSVYMAIQLGNAASALYQLPSDELWDRFIAWTKPATLDAR